MVAREAVLGLVLCGGASRRMGRDKARIEWRGTPLIARALAILDAVAQDCALACGATPRYAELGRRCVLDEVPDAGPLAGLVAGLAEAERCGAEWLAVLAVDVAALPAGLYDQLLAEAQAADAGLCVLTHPGGTEPLVGVYRTTCLAPARAALAAGERRVVSFWSALRTASVEGDQPLNVNTPEDLREAQA